MLQKNNSVAEKLHSKVVATIESFAPLPSVAMRVLEILADPQAQIADLEAVLRSDLSLVTSVLKLANSAFFGVRRQVDSLRHALLLLGRSEVQSLVVSRMMFRAFAECNVVQKAMIREVWTHSLRCAIAAETLSKETAQDDPICFLGGMLHDIGRIVVILKFAQDGSGFHNYETLSEEEGLEMECNILGCGHDELGTMLLHRWMFPETLGSMVRNHHDYDGIGSHSPMVQILILADILSRLVVAQDLLEEKKSEPAVVESLYELLYSCWKKTSILDSDISIERLLRIYRNNIVAKSDLLALLQM